MKLTGKQARFVTEYINSLNGTQAAIAAGYSVKTARSIASENLRKLSVQTEIASQQCLRQERFSASREYLIQKLVRIVEFDLSRLFDKNNCPLPIHQWPPEASSVVHTFKYGPIAGRPGQARSNLQLHDRLDVLELIGDITGAFVRRKIAGRRPSTK